MKVTGVAIRFVGEFKHLKRQRGYWVSVFNTMQNIWAGVVQEVSQVGRWMGPEKGRKGYSVNTFNPCTIHG